MMYAFALEAQVVNIERKRIATDTTGWFGSANLSSVSYTHLRAHETVLDLVCRLLLEKKKKRTEKKKNS